VLADVFANVIDRDKRTVQILANQCRGGLRRRASNNFNRRVHKQQTRSFPHAACNDYCCAVLLEPYRQEAWLMFRGRYLGRRNDFSGFGIYLDKSEFITVSKVRIQAISRYGNGDLHGWISFLRQIGFGPRHDAAISVGAIYTYILLDKMECGKEMCNVSSAFNTYLHFVIR